MPSSKTSSSLPHTQQGSTIFGFIVGLFVGLILAVVVAFFAADIRFSGSDKLNPAPSEESVASVPPSTAPNPNATLLPQKEEEATEGGFSVVKEHVPNGTGLVITDELQVRAPGVTQSTTETLPAQTAPTTTQTTTQKPAAPTVTPSAPAASGYYVQVGAFRTQADAQTQRAKLAFLGENGVISRYNNGAEDIYRVRLGPYPTRALAEKSHNNLQKAGLESVVVSVKQ